MVKVAMTEPAAAAAPGLPGLQGLPGPAGLGDALGQSVRRLTVGNASSMLTELAAPWGIHFPHSSAVAGFHLACEGAVWVAPAGRDGREAPAGFWLAPGDLVLFPFGTGHTVADAPGSPSLPYYQVQGVSASRTHAILCGAYKLGGGGLELAIDDPVLSMLPPALHVRAAQIAAVPAFVAVLAALREEAAASHAGRDAVINSLVGAAFVYIVRSHLAAGESTWAGAPRDPRMTRTLAAIHRSPGERWTVEKLAELARMSRASFARRFAQLVGDTPLAYVAARRLDLAARLLRESEQQLGEIAATVGYESEFALSRAFKRSRNLAPGRYRALHRSGAVELR